ncbi:acyltransferase family protein [Escherichia albertii]|uniref:acyltransferase family protein n=1 Tax=Escherichia albertii TaxID=208962 RepID=UPI000DE42CE7|nr:acyltransferase [Escherichia albertii]EFB7458538.1 acyltransferase [Escherichia albertii]MCZ8597824.1 acyltransferase [Escherichia albertii]HCJ5727359.1 acyltransferase [Escherichia coli]
MGKITIGNNTVKTSNRVESLDYLRGLMALSVVIYHYVSWSGSSGLLGSEHILGRLGVYAVSSFYVLSGLSLAYVYDGTINNAKSAISFGIKRVFRIAPLFWVSITLSLMQRYLSNHDFIFPTYEAILNYTLTFGFISPTSYFSTGAWSIGNEMVFYAILCIAYLLSVKIKYLMNILFLVSALSWLYFAFFLFDKEIPLAEQWGTYINPFNQLFFFMSGVISYRIIKREKLKKNNTTILLCALVSAFVFCFFPAQGDSIAINYGVTRVVLSLSCILFIVCVYIADVKIKNTAFISLEILGQISYSIYLLHPIVADIWFALLKKAHIKYNIPYVYALSFATVIVVGYISYRLLEKPLMIAGSKLAKSIN